MQMIGILGGVASGKSLVASQLVELGAGLLDADRAGHEALRLPKVEDAARHRWGQRVFDSDGRIDRERLAQIVFTDSPQGSVEREYLEQLTHPEIGRLLREQTARLADDGCVAVVLDAPLLLEVGWDRFCNMLIMVDSPRRLRLARALARGWTMEEFTTREDAQESLDLKRERADVIIDNSGSPEQTRAQVEHFWCSHVG